MANVSDLLRDDLINLNMAAGDKVKALEELADLISEKEKISDREKFIKSIMAREGLESTGIGRGVAIPHARTDTVERTVIALGRSREGVDFASLDGKPAHLIFLIVSPERDKSLYIKTLARISRLVRRDEFRRDLLRANSKEEVIALVRRNEEELAGPSSNGGVSRTI